MYRFRLNKKVIGESCKGIALAVKRSPTDNIQLQRVVGGFLAGWLFFSSALTAVERRGVGWGGVARRRNREGGRQKRRQWQDAGDQAVI